MKHPGQVTHPFCHALAQYYDLPHHIYCSLIGNEVKLSESLRYHNTLQTDTYIYFKCSASIADNLQAMTKCHLQKERGATPHQLPGLWAMHQTSVFPLSPPYDFSSVIIIILLLQLSTFLFLFSPMPAYCSPRSVLQEGRNASKHTEGQQAKSSSGAR